MVFLTGVDMSASLMRELETELNLVLMADVPIAKMDPEARPRRERDIKAARQLCADLLNAMREARRRQRGR